MAPDDDQLQIIKVDAHVANMGSMGVQSRVTQEVSRIGTVSEEITKVVRKQNVALEAPEERVRNCQCCWSLCF